MLNRILIAILGIPILAYVYYYGGIPLLIFVNLVVGIGLHEFFSMVKKSGKDTYSTFGIIAGLSVVNMTYFANKLSWKYEETSLIVISMIILMIYRVLKNKVENSSVAIGTTILGIIYIAVFFSKMLSISFLPNGGKLLLTLQVLVWLCDSFAYFVGLSFGRKFFKRGFSEISPKKSIEGSIGGAFFTTISLYVVNHYCNIFPTEFSVASVIIMGIALSLLIQIGDLAESMFKREFGIKDSSRLLGEHGGILDRFDSLIFVLPIVFYFFSSVIY